MPPEPHTTMGMASLSNAMILVAHILVSFVYVRGWRGVRAARVSAIPAWRVASFLFGMFLIWAALASPLAAYDHNLLTAHMIQHLLLMTFAPALILLGEPLLAFWGRWPRLGKIVLGTVFRQPFVRRFARVISRPALCWIVSALTLLGWHVPRLFTLGMHSEVWHFVEQASFLGAGFLFWWPVVQPWPSVSRGPQWSTLLYLFAATLPCDILSGFLAFSDRVAYPVYLSTPRLFGFSVLEDQQCAAALMWTCVTFVYLVPAVIICSKLLAPRTSHELDVQEAQFSEGPLPQRAPLSLEVV